MGLTSAYKETGYLDARAATIASTSYTHPPQVPPLTPCNAAHNRVSSGNLGSARRSGRGFRWFDWTTVTDVQTGEPSGLRLNVRLP